MVRDLADGPSPPTSPAQGLLGSLADTWQETGPDAFAALTRLRLRRQAPAQHGPAPPSRTLLEDEGRAGVGVWGDHARRAPLMLFRLGSDRPAHELPSLLGESSARDGSRTRRYRGEQGSGVWAGWLRGRLHRMTYVSVLCVLISLNPGTFASGFTGNTEKSFVFQFTK